MTGEKFIAALDVGTTTIRCHIFDSSAKVIAQASTDLILLYPSPGLVEIDPDVLWRDILSVINNAIKLANLKVEDVACLGLATQRGTFMTWRKDNGRKFHNFITWKDLRAKELVKEWNNSLSMKAFRAGAYFLYSFSRSKRYLAGSKLLLTNIQVTLRLLWVLQNTPGIKKEISKNNVMFGTLDTWIVYKLTKGKMFVSDYTNASSTGMFDPFVLDWGSWISAIFKIPKGILPPTVSNDFDFGRCEKSIFGCEIPITCAIADQQASMFGSCCFSKDILKVTLGTGSFLNVKTDFLCNGDGIYPLIGYKMNSAVAYIAEGSCNDTGSLIQWALRTGLCKDPSETSDLAENAKDNDGVYFIPAFSGLGPPICDDKAASGFLGLKPTTTNSHMVRAILESIVYRIILQYETLKCEVNTNIKRVYVDGGVSKNDFICQMLADMLDLEVERPATTEMSAMGIAFIAGLNSGIWKNVEELNSLRKVDKIFTPTRDKAIKDNYYYELKKWYDVVDRFKSWYS